MTVRTHTHMWFDTKKRTQVTQGFLLTAPVPYRYHPLPLASSPAIKEKRGKGDGEECNCEEDDNATEAGFMPLCTLGNEIDWLIPLMYG